MAKLKREFLFCSPFDYDYMVARLEKRALQGWKLKNIRGGMWEYEKIPSKRLHYAVTYFPKASQFDPEPSEQQQIFWEFCESAGWEPAVSCAQFQVFVSEREHPIPLETDAQLALDNIHQTAKKTILISYTISVFAFIIAAFLSSAMLFDNSIEYFSSNILMVVTLTQVFAAMASLYELIHYFCWRHKAKRFVRDYGKLPPTGNAPFIIRGVILGMIPLILIGFLFSSSIWFLMGGLFNVAFILFIIWFIKWLLKRKKVPAKTSRIVFVISVVVIPFLSLIFLMFFGFLLFASQDRSASINPSGEQITLTVSDILPELSEESYFHHSEKKNSSLFLSYQAADDKPTGESFNLPDLRYQAVEVKVPFLYDAVKKQLLERLRGYRIFPKITWENPAPWNAKEVFVLRDEAPPGAKYLVCTKTHIFLVDFSHDLTDKQKALITEKLTA